MQKQIRLGRVCDAVVLKLCFASDLRGVSGASDASQPTPQLQSSALYAVVLHDRNYETSWRLAVPNIGPERGTQSCMLTGMPAPQRKALRRTARAGLFAMAALTLGGRATASDHLDGTAQPDAAVDLGDVYAWPTDDGRIAVALTMGGSLMPGEAAAYDTEVVYAIHINYVVDNNRWLADESMYIQFGTEPESGAVGVRVRGIPGSGGANVSGPVEETLRGQAGEQVWAGVRDDPAFHDAEGWATTLSEGTWELDASRDAHAMTNTVAVTIEFDAPPAARAPMRIWATSGRWER